MNHFYVVTCAARADVCDARLTVNFCGDAFENRFHDIPSGCRAAGHNGWTFTSTFFTTGNTGTDEAETKIAEPFVAAFCIGVERISTIDDDVAFIEKREE